VLEDDAVQGDPLQDVLGTDGFTDGPVELLRLERPVARGVAGPGLQRVDPPTDAFERGGRIAYVRGAGGLQLVPFGDDARGLSGISCAGGRLNITPPWPG
jgi:hypothetical protein